MTKISCYCCSETITSAEGAFKWKHPDSHNKASRWIQRGMISQLTEVSETYFISDGVRGHKEGSPYLVRICVECAGDAGGDLRRLDLTCSVRFKAPTAAAAAGGGLLLRLLSWLLRHLLWLLRHLLRMILMRWKENLIF